MRTFEEKILGERMGNARRKGNEDALDDIRLRMRRLVKIFDQVTGKGMSHIDSKAVDQAKQIARLDTAISDFDDALYELKKITGRNKR